MNLPVDNITNYTYAHTFCGINEVIRPIPFFQRDKLNLSNHGVKKNILVVLDALNLYFDQYGHAPSEVVLIAAANGKSSVTLARAFPNVLFTLVDGAAFDVAWDVAALDTLNDMNNVRIIQHNAFPNNCDYENGHPVLFLGGNTYHVSERSVVCMDIRAGIFEGTDQWNEVLDDDNTMMLKMARKLRARVTCIKTHPLFVDDCRFFEWVRCRMRFKPYAKCFSAEFSSIIMRDELDINCRYLHLNLCAVMFANNLAYRFYPSTRLRDSEREHALDWRTSHEYKMEMVTLRGIKRMFRGTNNGAARLFRELQLSLANMIPYSQYERANHAITYSGTHNHNYSSAERD